MDELINKIKDIIKCSVPFDVVSNMQDEGVSVASFCLLSEDDLKSLGFKLGPRKLILSWIKEQQTAEEASPITSSEVFSVNASVSNHGAESMADPVTPRTTAVITSTPIASTSTAVTTPIVTDQIYPLETILNNVVRNNRGPDLVARLKNGDALTRDDRIFLVKIAGKYLMKNCIRLDEPSVVEKVLMAKSIIKTFPSLKNKDTTHGYEEYYDPRAHCGHLERFIRQKRCRDPSIVTKWKKKPRGSLMESTEAGDDERVLREMKPTSSNKQQILDLMERSRAHRRLWINANKPDATTILRKYPRLIDVNETVEEEFAAIVSCGDRHLRDNWRAAREKILSHGASQSAKNSDLQNILKTLNEDDFDEDKKTEVSIKVLPYLLVPPPKRGLKKPRLGRSAALQMLFVEIEDIMSVPEALSTIADNTNQPLLFRLQDAYYVKVDKYAIAAKNVSCFCDAVEFLMKLFYVLNLEYEYDLKPVFGLLEKVWGIPVSIGSSSALNDFMRTVL